MGFSGRRHDSGCDDSGRDNPAENIPGRESGDIRLSARVFGVVQGVGFRFWTMGKADELGLNGVVRNLDDGSVAIEAEGPEQQVQKLLDWLRSENAPGRVERVEESISAADGSYRDFRAR
ncbi:acylphosphatase [Pseudarthrobacter sp. AL07]|uniref:acylphosphatase n=1 Tax=unclassified Pseudarthrobacter TaxID=2647000 RepID=UPI002499E447|nr:MULTISPECIES: acylphosphatase [unclassified Pseudarthrobacter]MDI3195173.1 acylphosphatase [Pseudarthrobacter sp. AL20]MDI3209239.1 acylphosphatase [Pseudarthrobacter sp. AL07]